MRDGLAQAARRMQRFSQGRPTRDDSIHLTLAFVGAVTEVKLARLLAPPADVFTPAFRLTLDSWGCWVHNGIGWAAPLRIPTPLSDLAANLANWLRAAGFDLERRAFKPHVTLVRKANCAPMPEDMTPVEWRVEEFALICSRFGAGGVRYETLHAWPLK